MRIATIVMTLIVGLASWGLQATAVEHRMNVVGRIAIDADGRVTERSLETKLPAAIDQALKQHIDAWRFEPVEVDGRPVVATTRMQLSLRLVEADEQFSLYVENAHFGALEALAERQRGRGEIRYPTRALERGISGRVTLAVRVQADGSVIEVHPYQTSLGVRTSSEREAERYRAMLEQASVRAVANWQFDMNERIDGQVHETTVMLPIEFRIVDSPSRSSSGTWQSLIPGPVRPVPWQASELVEMVDVSELGHGEALALNSRFRLLDVPADKPN